MLYGLLGQGQDGDKAAHERVHDILKKAQTFGAPAAPEPGQSHRV